MTAQTAREARANRQLRVRLTRDSHWIRAAQKLRYDVFSEEYDSDLGATEPGIDADVYDPHCEHLLVVEENSGQLVATTRILHQDATHVTGGFYSAGEFKLDGLLQSPGVFAELGRTCVHPDFRNGATIAVLWAGVADYLQSRDVDYLIGCASIGMADGGRRAWRIAQQLKQHHLAEPAYRVTPRRAMPHIAETSEAPTAPARVPVPPLIKAYMRLGAEVCGEPCWDPEFRCADLLVLLAVTNLNTRYVRHFMKKRPAA
ncbi:GNAT family N-acyltransferase [Marinobacteraceae bacterium S3BR75-40.1]